MFKILKTKQSSSKEEITNKLNKANFGTLFSEHMFTMHYDSENGWHNAQIEPFNNFSLHPASAVFHYGQAIFEGLKIFLGKDNNLRSFRINKHSDRFNNSAKRLLMPQIDKNLFKQAIFELVKLDKNFVPKMNDGSLYLRPFMFANQDFLGVGPSSKYIFCIIASSVNNYFKNKANAINIWIEQEYVRAFPGGVGSAKFAGNYAASYAAQQKASQYNCDQVLFLDGINHTNFEELGAMNIFFVIDNELITPQLNDIILNGITRDSIIHIAKDLGFKVSEQNYSLQQLCKDANNNKILEAFACGTAATIVSINKFKYENGEVLLTNNSVSAKLRRKLQNIQFELEEDKYNWIEIIN